MQVISRKHAIELKMPRYFTGKPCKNGHVSERDAPSGRCIACIREWTKDSYQRRRETVLEDIRERRLNDDEFAQACRDRALRYHNENKQALRERVQRTRKTEEYRSRSRQKYASNRAVRASWSAAWRKANPGKVAESELRYRKINRGKVNAKNAARSRHVLVATPKWADLSAIRDIYERAAAAGLQVDHIVPLRHPLVCGLHCEANLQMLTAEENRRKGNRYWPDMPEE